MAGVVADAHPLPLPGAADRRAQEHAGGDHHRDAAPAGGASRATGRASPRATRSAAAKGTGGFAISANILGPDLDQIVGVFEAGARRGAERAEHHRSQDQPERLESRGPRRRRSQARRRSRRAHGDHRQHAAAGGLRRRSDLASSRKARSSIRSRSACSRASGGDIAEIGRLTVPSATGPVRIDNIARLERGLGPTTLQRSNRQFTVNFIADVAPGPRARRGVERRPQDAGRPQHAADDVVPAAGTVEDPRRDDGEPDHGDRPRDDLRLHGARRRSSRASSSRSSSCWCCRSRCRSRCSRCG